MTERINPAPDAKKVTLNLTLGQVRLLEKLVESTLADVEEFGEYEGITEKALQKLCDRFWEITHIPLTPEEKQAATDDWVKSFTHKDFVRVHGFDPYAEKEVQS